MNDAGIAAALRQLSRGLAALAVAVGEDESLSTADRYRAVLNDWADRGLTREQASALLRGNGFAPQVSGGWARGNWIETRDDGLRYLSARSLDWLRENGVADV